MFFPVSKIGWLLIQPLGLLTIALALTTLFAWRRGARLAALLAAVSLAGLLVATQTNLGRLLLQPLENRHARPANVSELGDIAGIVVLGGGFDGHVSLTRGGFELGESGDRFVEAVRLARLLADKPLIVSGGEASLIGKTEGDAAIATRFFAAFGIAPDRLILEDRSMNTYENAVFTDRALPENADGEWLLVTSAFHMPRALAAFRLQGVPVIAWPVDFRTSGEESFAIGRDDPAEALDELTLALREWTGFAVYRMTGRIGGN